MSISHSNMMVVSMAVTGHAAVCLCLGGDVDLAAEPDLAILVDNAAAARRSAVHLDLPSHAAVNLCRPGWMTRRLIELTSVPGVVSVRHDTPADWPALRASAQVPDAVTTVVPACKRRR